jgi:hypothetical protein
MPANGTYHDEEPSTALIPVAPPLDALAIQRAPDQVLEEAARAAQALKQVIEAKPNKLIFNKKTYLQFEDWQTLGRFYGVTAVSRSTKYVEYGEGEYAVRGFEATAEALLVGNNQVISCAEAMCLDDEQNWSRKPLFQLKSMAQTRACAKVLRNVLAWVVVLAGYAPTPAEEMDGESSPSSVSSPRRKSAKVEPITPNYNTISFTEQRELFEIGEKKGWTRPQVMAFLHHLGHDQPGDITTAQFPKVRTALLEA